MISRLGIPPPPPSLESILGPSFDTIFCATPIRLFGCRCPASQDFFGRHVILGFKRCRIVISRAFAVWQAGHFNYTRLDIAVSRYDAFVVRSRLFLCPRFHYANALLIENC